jgi:hypothetical protein
MVQKGEDISKIEVVSEDDLNFDEGSKIGMIFNKIGATVGKDAENLSALSIINCLCMFLNTIKKNAPDILKKAMPEIDNTSILINDPTLIKKIISCGIDVTIYNTFMKHPKIEDKYKTETQLNKIKCSNYSYAQGRSMTGFSGYVISKNSKNKDNALKWIELSGRIIKIIHFNYF